MTPEDLPKPTAPDADDAALEAAAEARHAEVTQIIDAARGGDREAADRLLTLVYAELRTLAKHRLAKESPGHTLQATALVHEAYLRLLGDANAQWQNRGHFFAAAAEAMRRILIESARRKKRLKHGGGRQRVDGEYLPHLPVEADAKPEELELLTLDEALSEFAEESAAKAELVKLRYFAGLTIPQAAEVLGISRATAERWWAFSRAWLFERMQREEG